jgi:hypothetical protein
LIELERSKNSIKQIVGLETRSYLLLLSTSYSPIIIEPEESERYTVHYQPIVVGTNNTLCAKGLKSKEDGTAVLRAVSDSRRLHSPIRYNPNGESEQISVSDRLKGNKHISPVKINGIIRWKSYFEIHAYTVGWRTSSKLGNLKLNIPGIDGMRNGQKKGMESSIHFEDNEDLRLVCSFDRRNNISSITVDDHPLIESVEEIPYDELNWFHEAYPFSGSSVGVRIGFKTDMQYDSLNFNLNSTISLNGRSVGDTTMKSG